MSAAAARREAARIRALHDNPEPLAPVLRQRLDSYKPLGVADAEWQTVAGTVHSIMERSQLKNLNTFDKHLRVLAGYMLWRHQHGRSHLPVEALTFVAIDEFFRGGLEGRSERTRDEYRGRLRMLAQRVNPGESAPPRLVTSGRHSVRPGYSASEEAAICRVVQRIVAPKPRRSMCAIVGLSAGAGLGSEDLRPLIRAHIEDRGVQGIVVNVPGRNGRRVAVRREYEDIVRVGLEGLSPSSLVLGTKVNRRNVTGNIIDGSGIIEKVPDISTARLRNTWLSWLLVNQVPLKVVLDAAGLASAQTITDLLDTLPDVDDVEHYLRDGGAK